MQKLSFTTGVVLIGLASSFAQSVGPVQAPDDVILELGIEGDGHQFHIGELVPVKYSYRSNTSDKYIWVSQSNKLVAGHSFDIACSPSSDRLSTHSTPTDGRTFGQLLSASCGGVGSGFAGGCGDCDWEHSLTAAALSFGVVPLNKFVKLRTPGTYTCEASSVDVTTAPRAETFRPALLVRSNPIAVTILNDPQWAHSAASAYADAYLKLCRADAEPRLLQCFDITQRITYLDNADSLATEVKWFDGRNHGWDNGFWNAIQRSPEPLEALRLVASRMQDRDFQVSNEVLEWLARSELSVEMPDAFQSGEPATYHAQAVEKLRKYVRLLGSSLSKKDSTVLAESIKTYRAGLR